MGLVKINGKYYRVEDGTTQADIDAFAKSQGAASVKLPARAPATQQARKPSARAVERSMTRHQGTMFFGMPRMVMDQITQGVLGEHADELEGGISAATRGVFNAIRKGDMGEIKREYYTARDAAREDMSDVEQNHRAGSMAAKLSGALLTPLPKVKILSKAPALVRGAAEGAAMSAISGAGASKELSDVPEQALKAGLIGAGFGGVVGAGTSLARKGARALQSQGEGEAANVAYSRIAKALEDSPRYPGTSSPLRHTPESAAREISVGRGRGVEDYAVADLSPEMSKLQGFVTRKNASGAQNDVFHWAEGRMANRNNSFDDQVRQRIQPHTGQDALSRTDQLKGAHRQAGANYDQIVTDNAPANWSPELDAITFSDNPIMRAAIKDGFRRVKGKDLDPTEVGFVTDAAGNLVGISEKPTWRAFDLIRRSLGRREQALRKAGDFDGARDVANKYHELRDAMGAANPEYTDMLAAQRSVFEQEKGLELGREVLSKIGTQSRETLVKLKGLKPQDFEEARTGFVEELLRLRDRKGSPIATLQAMMGNPNQREVLNVLFKGGSNLRRFERWLRRQRAASMTDKKVAGAQSNTSENMLMNEEHMSPSQELASTALRGFGFGGGVGMVGNSVNLLERFRSRMSDKALGQLARILMGDGSDLAAGVTAAKKATARRKAGDARAVRGAARSTGFLIGSEAGE